jgi:hypothetical protein
VLLFADKATPLQFGMDALVDLDARAIIGRNHQRVLRRFYILLRDSGYAFVLAWNLIVFSQANASLGLVSGAPTVEPKSPSIGWAGLFSESVGTFAGTAGAGRGAISGICRCENLGGLNRILPIFILHLWIKLGRGRTHLIVSLSRPLCEDRSCNTLRTANSKSTIAATQSNGINEMPTRHWAGCPEGARNRLLVNVTSVWWINKQLE